jgi:hypothetical protein
MLFVLRDANDEQIKLQLKDSSARVCNTEVLRLDWFNGAYGRGFLSCFVNTRSTVIKSDTPNCTIKSVSPKIGILYFR